MVMRSIHTQTSAKKSPYHSEGKPYSTAKWSVSIDVADHNSVIYCFIAESPASSPSMDLRAERLVDRKQELRRLLFGHPSSRLRYADHVERQGTALFERICKLDVEGIVAKLSHGPYVTEPQQVTWFKIRNSKYSQMAGREELFQRERHTEPAPG
jgi:hypothetical protein